MIPFAYQAGGAGRIIAGVAPGPASGWDPARIFQGATLSDSNKLATGESGDDYSHVRSVQEITGLRYFSGVVGGDVGFAAIGVATDGSNPLNDPLDYLGNGGGDVGAWVGDGIYQSGGRIHAVSATAWEFAVRASSRRVWVRQNGGAWLGGGNPATDTTPTVTLALTGALRACCTVARLTSTARLHNAAETTGTPPAGFSVGL